MTERINEKKLKYICPQGHNVPYKRWNYAKDDSDNLRDADGRPMFESGLFCHICNRAYGLSKLVESPR